MLSSSNHTNNNSQDRMVDEDHQEVDEKLYSRQLYVLGVDAMKRMQQSNVLICGLGGLGVEVAKNVILTGVKSVTLYDPKNVTFDDLSAQFYASEKDIGQNRAEVSLQQLKELNQYVPVKIHKGDLTEDFITQFAVVVFTDTHIPQLVEMNEICHKHNVRFIACESRGLMGSLFCDFGTNFTVYDPDGENVVSNIVTDITNGYPATVTVYDDKPTHGLYDDEYVQFEGIEGMDEINKVSEPIKIKVSGKHTFKIDLDTRNFGEYKSGSGGYVKQVKVPTSHSYQPLKDQLANPTCIDFDFAKFSRPQQIHLAMLALSEYEKRNQSLPKPYNKADAERLLEIAKEIAPDALKEHLDEKIVKLLAYTCRGNLNPMAAFLGGIVAQETQKACSGKFSPLNQYFHFDALECLPEDESSYPTEEDCQPTSTRYDGQISVFGKAFQHKLADVKEFVVGAGALGCEFLKNYAMMGVGCGPNGKVFVTDMDSIEVSNLNRQFLFRRRHVGQQKSTTAAEAVKAMNPEFHVIALQDKVAPETEQTFDDDFWEQLSGVTNALDNVQARLYVDTRCVYYGKPLLESGTLGTKGNTQVVVPKLTESYGTTRDPPEKEIPICTLKNFPNAIEHTIQWARDSFEGFFNKVPNDVNTYLSKTDYIKELDSLASKKAVLESVYESLVSNKPLSFEDCISWARLKFEQLFRNNIMQLLYNFPLDMVTSTGTPFWGGAKRPPVPLSFDPNDPLHLDFVVSAANLRAFVYGLKGGSKDEYDFKAIVSKIKVPPFQPKSGVKIQSDEKENKEPEQEFSDSDEQEMQQLQSQIPKPNDMAGFRLNVAEFEKDDDTNYHIDFITAASNLRARNYKIPEVDRHKTKGIAGKIIPAMVTTTALITGLVGFEFYKLMQGFNKIAAFKNAFVNIALPFVTFSEPGEPPKQKYLDVSWTLWDRFEVDEGRDITLKEFMDIFKERFKLEITMMSAGKSMIYSFFGNKKAIEEKMKTPLGQLVETVSQTQFLPKQKYVNFEICCQDLENGDDQEVPYVRYKFRGW